MVFSRQLAVAKSSKERRRRKEMTQNNSLQGYNWDSQQCEIGQALRPLQDEVISVYEVYVKEEEETSGPSERSHDSGGISGISESSTRTSSHNVTSTTISHDPQLLQRSIFKDHDDLDVAAASETVSDGAENSEDTATVMKLLGKESLKYKIVEQSTISGDDTESGLPNRTVSEQMSAASFTGPRLIDKDDPRSRLHFVKYLKRDGKTLKIWECGICTKEFRHQYTLMRHLPTHTDERNFKCDACGKAFRQLSTLSQHKAIHSDARPYVCEFCKKTFNRVSTLISHRKTHSELKPHKCHVCGKGFHQKGNLRNHVFTHTNERPYKCEMCGKGFNQMSNLVCHKIKAHAHSEKMQYSCGICGKEFPRRFALRSHEEYRHGIKYRNPGGISRERKPPLNQKSSTSTSACSTASSAICNATLATTVATTGSSVMQNKNVRIVELPDHERNEELTAVETSQTEYTDSIVINRIETKDLQNAIIEGQTPFALLKPVTGIPVLVKVSPAGPHKHLLTPATAEDLQMLGKMALSPSVDPGLKALHIKVPVVATITQHLDDDGKQSFSIEAPGADQNQESLVAPLDSQFPFQNTESSLRLHSASTTNVCANRSIDEIAIDANGQSKSGATVQAPTNSQPDDCNELLELAAQGGIQFVRATEDGRYEVMTNNEARELMAQNSHDVTILDGEDADALNIVNARAGEMTSSGCCLQEDFMIDHPDSQIMVLDSITNGQKSVDLEAIDIFEDKDIRILDPKSFDERMIDGMTFLSQMKMDDLVFVPNSKSCSADGMNGCAITIASPSNNPADFTGIAAILNNSRNNCVNGQSMSVTSLLTKAQHSSNLSIISDTMNYLRHCPPRNIGEESSVLNADKEPTVTVCASDNHHHHHHHYQQQQRIYQTQEHYTGQMKFNDFEDAMDTGESSDLIPISERERNDRSCSINTTDYYRDNEAKTSYWDHKRNNAVALADVKSLATKNNSANQQEPSSNPAAQFQDIRVLGSYEQYLNSSSFGHKEFVTSGNNYATEDAMPNGGRKEVKILGKRLECGFLENDENGKLIKIEDDAGGVDTAVTGRRIANDFWEGWIETNRTANNDTACDEEEDDNERNNDVNYGNIIDSQTL